MRRHQTGMNTSVPMTLMYAPKRLRCCIVWYIWSLTVRPVIRSICWTCMSRAAWRPRSVNCGAPCEIPITSAQRNKMPTALGDRTTSSYVAFGDEIIPMARAIRPFAGAGGGTGWFMGCTFWKAGSESGNPSNCTAREQSTICGGDGFRRRRVRPDWGVNPSEAPALVVDGPVVTVGSRAKLLRLTATCSPSPGPRHRVSPAVL